MHFFIDENIWREIIEFLKEKGHDVAVVPSGIEDDMVAKLAKKENHVLLTSLRKLLQKLFFKI
jgi:uncharacterized protein with PIN domain